MRVAIRVDASLQIGTGHVKRCLSLTLALLELGAQVSFVTRSLDGVSAQVLVDAPCPVHWLPAPSALANLVRDGEAPPHATWAGVHWTQDVRETTDALCAARPDWLVVDHYAFDSRWHEALRQAVGCRLLVIDDIGDRYLAPDALLDHNWALDHRAKYAGRLTREPYWLTGPRFALLAPAYRQAKRYRFSDSVRSMGIFMGGTDPGGITTQVLTACRNAGFCGSIEVVSTSANPQLAVLRTNCDASHDTTLTLDEPDLAAFFARHDLQIGAGGGATWERCCIGVPSVLVTLADNQTYVLNAIVALGVAEKSGIGLTELTTTIRNAIDNSELRRQMWKKSTQLVDGNGAERTAEYLSHGD